MSIHAHDDLKTVAFAVCTALQAEDVVAVLTGGGPLTTTESVQVLAYRIAFKQQGMSLSMAAMVIFAAVVLALVIALRRANREQSAL